MTDQKLTRARLTTEQRFDAKWKVGPVPAHRPDLGPCRIWTAGKNSKGYGTFRVTGQKSPVLAYHYAWKRAGRSVPKGKQLDHQCHVRACVHEDHLQVVKPKTNSENRKGANSNTTSGYRGVHWSERDQRWIVEVGDRGKKHYGGRFLRGQEKEAGKRAEELRAQVYRPTGQRP